jgi:hypothetical protein
MGERWGAFMGKRTLEDLSPEERQIVEAVLADLRELDEACKPPEAKRPPRSKQEQARFDAAVDAAIKAGILDKDVDRSALLWHDSPDDVKQIDRGRRAGDRRGLLNQAVSMPDRRRAAMERMVLAEAKRERVVAEQETGGREAFKENVKAQSAARENHRSIERKARSGLNKKQTAEALRLNIKTVRKHWPSDL